MNTLHRISATLGLPLAAALASPAVHAAAVDLTSLVDTTVCASGAVQCSLNGHTAEAAASTNHNPVALRVTVVNKSGLPVTNLTSAAFNFVDAIVPAGGGAAVTCSVANCGASTFINAGNGLYQIYLDRGPTGNWKAGGYAGTLQVTAGTNSGTALVTFTIPN